MSSHRENDLECLPLCFIVSTTLNYNKNPSKTHTDTDTTNLALFFPYPRQTHWDERFFTLSENFIGVFFFFVVVLLFVPKERVEKGPTQAKYNRLKNNKSINTQIFFMMIASFCGVCSLRLMCISVGVMTSNRIYM